MEQNFQFFLFFLFQHKGDNSGVFSLIMIVMYAIRTGKLKSEIRIYYYYNNKTNGLFITCNTKVKAYKLILLFIYVIFVILSSNWAVYNKFRFIVCTIVIFFKKLYLS